MQRVRTISPVRYEPYTVVFHDAFTEHWDTIEAGGCRMFFVELLAPWADVVATQAGFTDQSHMTRIFKRMTGVTPGVYRRHRGGRPSTSSG